MKINKFKKNEQTREPKLHAIHNFPVGSFAVRDHLRSDLGIISGRGSFAVGDHLRRCDQAQLSYVGVYQRNENRV